MANPRKFSEKIALHTQKQAEETAAFDQIMKEVNLAINVQHKPEAFHHLDEMKHGRQVLVDRVRRQTSRHRMSPLHPFDRRIDASPYYLTPPADSSWRRANSDSALHQSAIALSSTTETYQGSVTPPTQRRVVDFLDSQGCECWDSKKHNHMLISQQQQSRQKSEVPGIHIHPSENVTQASIPINSNTGSLPDLSNLHFPSPLTNPLDPEEYTQQIPNVTSLSPRTATVSPQHQRQQSPTARRRQPGSSNISPLVLSTPQRHQQHQSPVTPGSPHGISAQGSDMTSMIGGEQRLPQYGYQSGAGSQPTSPIGQQSPQFQTPHSSPQSVPQSPGLPQSPQSPSYPHSVPQSPLTPPSPQLPTSMAYRTSHSSENCTSPGPQSPLSPPSPSFGASPVGSPHGTPYGDAYFLNPQQQLQTNALQHQLEQFSMFHDQDMTCTTSVNGTAGIITIPTTTVYAQTTVGQDFSRFIQQCGMSNGSQSPGYTFAQSHYSPRHSTSSIPDIVLTGADEGLRQDLVRDIGNAMAGFDTDFFPSDEALKDGLDPLDIDGLQMLADPDLVADSACDDSFRLDGL
ncbi:PREDICTED: CREB-regulated transcription coactivator 1-like isoform X2 [Priapulus caudatus]|uniref:CREB-regulated transcription coactivator 1-like isoform X2 n=1 Tax=Priapulus caudatus TaxID=37621 RepID=A0ABM1DYL8_PRICU|nr:PREDICTED: CREB-regulated transcription coactivator 1-like isoform X2 [Priapulus caudatus]